MNDYDMLICMLLCHLYDLLFASLKRKLSETFIIIGVISISANNMSCTSTYL